MVVNAISENLPAAAILTLAAIVAAAMIGARRRLWDTTLVAPWAWAGGSLALVAIWGVAASRAVGDEPAWLVHLRYTAGIFTLTPVTAVLGAKRPQDRGWQFVVAALVLILWLPSGEAWFLGRGDRLALHAAQRGFLALWIGAGVVNYGPTRFALSSALVALAQVLLFADFLPQPIPMAASTRPLWVWGCLAAAAGLAMIHRPGATRGANRVGRQWLDFRDAFGLFWALRTAQRMNADAARYGWEVEFTWRGVRYNSRPGGDVEPAVERALNRLLRRFLRRGGSETADRPAEQESA